MSIDPRIITTSGTPEGVAKSLRDVKRDLHNLKAAIHSLAPNSLTSDLFANSSIPPSAFDLSTPTRAHKVAAQALVSGSNKILLDSTGTPSFDPQGNFDIVTNSQYICPTTGMYAVIGVGAATTSGTNQWIRSSVFLNGSLNFSGGRAFSPASGDDLYSAFSGIVFARSNDAISLVINTAFSINLVAGGTGTFISLWQVG